MKLKPIGRFIAIFFKNFIKISLLTNQPALRKLGLESFKNEFYETHSLRV